MPITILSTLFTTGGSMQKTTMHPAYGRSCRRGNRNTHRAACELRHMSSVTCSTRGFRGRRVNHFNLFRYSGHF